MGKTKKRSIYYKKVVIMGGKTDKTLQELLQEDAFPKDKTLLASDREELISNDGEQTRLINRHTERSGMFFGQMIAYNAGESQPFLTKSPDNSYYKINAISAASIDQESSLQREFIQSILYFGVYKNHLVVMPSLSLRVKSLEHHLGWLLHDYSHALKPEEIIILQDRPSGPAKQKIAKLGGAKEVRIGSPLTFEPSANVSSDTSSTKITKWDAKSLGANIIKSILGAKWEALNIQNSLDDDNVVVEVVVKYKRKTSDEGQAMLDEIATSFRHIDEDDFRVTLNDGSTLNGEELKLSNKIEVSFSDDGYIAEADLYDEMHKWLMENYTDGNIED